MDNRPVHKPDEERAPTPLTGVPDLDKLIMDLLPLDALHNLSQTSKAFNLFIKNLKFSFSTPQELIQFVINLDPEYVQTFLKFVRKQEIFSNLQKKLHANPSQLDKAELVCLIFFARDTPDLKALRALGLETLDLTELDLNEKKRKGLELTLAIQLEVLKVFDSVILTKNEKLWQAIHDAQLYYRNNGISFAKFLNFSNAVFVGAADFFSTHDHKIQGWNFDGIDLSNTNLDKSNLQKISLIGADLSCSNLNQVSLRDAILHHANFFQARINETNLLNVKMLSRSDFNGAATMQKALDKLHSQLQYSYRRSKVEPSSRYEEIRLILIENIKKFFLTKDGKYKDNLTQENVEALQQAIDHPIFRHLKTIYKKINAATSQFFQKPAFFSNEQKILIALKLGLPKKLLSPPSPLQMLDSDNNNRANQTPTLKRK